jgi:hypothetical protein
MEVNLHEIAYSRSGDKGDISNIVVAPYSEDDYDWMCRHLTVAIVKSAFGELVSGEILRYELPGTSMLNFVMDSALQGGVSRSLAIDAHGKSRASLMLGITIECPVSDIPPSISNRDT